VTTTPPEAVGAVIIANTRSGQARQRAQSLVQRLAGALAGQGLGSVTLPFPALVQDAHHRSELLRHLDAGARRVYVLGGDGTVRSIATLLLGHDVPLGIVPLGTANLLARDLGVPLTAADAVAALTEPAVRRIDVARCNGSVFLCAAMFGITTDLARAREAARGLGTWRMLPRLLRKAYWVLKRYPFQRVRLLLDAEPVALTTRALAVSNNPLEPRPGLPPVRASLQSGQLGVYGVREGPLYDLPRLALTLLMGTWPGEPRVFHRVCRSLRIQTHKPTRTVALLDGEREPMHTPLRFDVLPAALPMLVPAEH
jgi:diacylglycerol kinase family enzyme